MKKTYKNCQSCAMPLIKDPTGGGTNADGTKSAMYCSYCFEQGKFHNPDWTSSQVQEFVKEKMKEMGYPRFMAGFFSRGIPRLERWKTS